MAKKKVNKVYNYVPIAILVLSAIYIGYVLITPNNQDDVFYSSPTPLPTKTEAAPWDPTCDTDADCGAICVGVSPHVWTINYFMMKCINGMCRIDSSRGMQECPRTSTGAVTCCRANGFYGGGLIEGELCSVENCVYGCSSDDACSSANCEYCDRTTGKCKIKCRTGQACLYSEDAGEYLCCEYGAPYTCHYY